MPQMVGNSCQLFRASSREAGDFFTPDQSGWGRKDSSGMGMILPILLMAGSQVRAVEEKLLEVRRAHPSGWAVSLDLQSGASRQSTEKLESVAQGQVKGSSC